MGTFANFIDCFVNNGGGVLYDFAIVKAMHEDKLQPLCIQHSVCYFNSF